MEKIERLTAGDIAILKFPFRATRIMLRKNRAVNVLETREQCGPSLTWQEAKVWIESIADHVWIPASMLEKQI